MFEQLIQTVQENISTIRAIIQLNEMLRKLAFEETAEIITIREDFQTQELTKQMIQVIPHQKKWLEYDRCAVVTRLYAVYESFVEDLIANWLLRLPELVPRYADLEDRIRNTHREGVGRLLLDLKKVRFSKLTEQTIVESLFSGIAGESKYNLIPEAFLFHEQNLRRDILEKLLADAGIPNAWRWIEKYRYIKKYIQETRGYQSTAEAELNQLILDRNEAAHGTLERNLSTSEMLYLADFILALCQALAELVTYQVILQQTSTGQAREIGKINRWFPHPRAGRAKVKNVTLSVGDTVFLVNENSADCRFAAIESIQLDDVSQSEIKITSETEVGLQFNINAKKGLSLYISDYF
jgi:hypothetical protein